MTSSRPDPIAARRAEASPPAPATFPPALPSRPELIWATTRSGEVYLTYSPEWSRRYAEEIKARREAERDDWLRRNGHPTTPPAPHWQDERDDE